MFGSFTCQKAGQPDSKTWKMVVIQKTNDDYTSLEFSHYHSDPDKVSFFLIQNSSDEGYINKSIRDPNVQYLSKCAGDRIENFMLGGSSLGAGDRVDENGDWVGFVYGANGVEVPKVVCKKN
jgi:hypothetical protein